MLSQTINFFASPTPEWMRWAILLVMFTASNIYICARATGRREPRHEANGDGHTLAATVEYAGRMLPLHVAKCTCGAEFRAFTHDRSVEKFESHLARQILAAGRVHYRKFESES